MSEKTKFHNMTKPVKFRKLKMIKIMIILWCKALRERIIYLFNYILYKLHILQRYRYRDRTEQVFPLPYDIKRKEIETNTFKGTVMMIIVKETFYDLDYFYRLNKDGSKKVTLYMKNEEESRLFVESYLEDICLRVKDKWYQPNSLPMLKVAIIGNKPVAFDQSSPLKPVEYETVEYDLLPLKTLKWYSLLGKITLSDVSEYMLNYYYDCACNKFLDKLKTITLHDLIK